LALTEDVFIVEMSLGLLLLEQANWQGATSDDVLAAVR